MISILIVEDDPMVRSINERFVSKIENYFVIKSVSDIDEAKEFLGLVTPNLILMDLFLPSGSGLDLLKWIRNKEIKTDIILITADRSIDAVDEGFRYGIIDYLVKPFTFKRFEQSLNNYKQRHNKLSNLNEIEQVSIDEYIVKLGKNKSNEQLIKGLNKNTYNQIANHIIYNKKCESFTSDEIADDLGLARVTVRRYLDYMVKDGKLELIQQYGKIGRPTHKFKYTTYD